MPERRTVTCAEFDGWSERTMRSARWSSWVHWIAGGAIAAVFSTLALSARSLRMRVVVGPWGVSSVVGLVITQRRTRRPTPAEAHAVGLRQTIRSRFPGGRYSTSVM
jgi:hypothetical protein